ncbi:MULTISPECIES: SHOCT-like domain-containing protein [Anaerolinea]|uniref:YvlB/LiaX N-terminal domain-containing protein n=1 Tax=Anaerolinea thermophila (strain DSM 14523 / JCM 11388 / NBRC 100420 / UNI-1) TaxID=926569 RepID=E8N1V2_ANATU|nr:MULTISPECIES: hypothetical protein [Anaerolinea]BAJ62707.1 hypothetical protein ANT_06730 [Anaerolinea thermophila UNI-1]
MATNEERMKILKMVAEGKITAEEADQLLEALEESERVPGASRPGIPPMPSAPEMPPAPGRKPRWLHVRVTDTNTGRTRVNVRLPVSMINIGLKMGSKFAPEVDGLNMDELMRMIESGEIGQIVDVTDEEDGEHVEVYLE